MRTEMMLKTKQRLGGDRDRGHRGPDKATGRKQVLGKHYRSHRAPATAARAVETAMPGTCCASCARLELLGLISTN